MKTIAMFSGGRDSTAMVFKLIDIGKTPDYVIFTDTESEFPEMYSYIQKVKTRLKECGITLIELHHKKGETFEDWVFGEVKSGKRKGMIRGLPMVTQPCFWKREAKVYPFKEFLKKEGITEYVQYIGYTASEKKRANVKDKNQRFPLIELNMCEADVDRYLESIDLVNPLYEKFERTGCYFCPYQKLRGFWVLWKEYPEQWAYMKMLEDRLDAMENVVNPQWNIRYTMQEMEEAFSSGTILYEVEAPIACECGR